MKTITSLALLLLLPFSASAAPGRKGFHPMHWIKNHKLLVISAAVFVASDVADIKATTDTMQRCPTCSETSDLFGPHPSAARLWGESGAIDAAYIAFDWYGTQESAAMGTDTWTAAEKAAHPKLYRLCWFERPVTLGIIGAATALHARAAYLNTEIPASK